MDLSVKRTELILEQHSYQIASSLLIKDGIYYIKKNKK